MLHWFTNTMVYHRLMRSSQNLVLIHFASRKTIDPFACTLGMAKQPSALCRPSLPRIHRKPVQMYEKISSGDMNWSFTKHAELCCTGDRRIEYPT
ncbi:hypothetical protein M433DRAFT_278026 [Acidomyces richmondensis BFW]|nr:MAG: hypothetical protein FE78DRAFT_431384 [Acidomyces sp. 'richmondensis']KYG44958.1 hypothetical protein M433DRAFT_278026 [Acidomyces richmondensis BFW]